MSDLSKRNCTVCLNAKHCRYIHPYVGFYCPGMESIVNNQTPSKEPLAGDLMGEGYEGFSNRDYKDVLNENIENKAEEHARKHDQIMSMPDERQTDLMRKVIAALSFFGVPISKIHMIVKLPERTFYRYYRGK